MTNQIAIGIGLAILALLSFDMFFFDWSGLVFLLKKLADLIEYLAFWR